MRVSAGVFVLDAYIINAAPFCLVPLPLTPLPVFPYTTTTTTNNNNQKTTKQMKGKTYNGQLHAFSSIWAAEGARGFYRGWSANTIKVVPQNAIRLVSYEALKGLLQVKKAKTDT